MLTMRSYVKPAVEDMSIHFTHAWTRRNGPLFTMWLSLPYFLKS
jgi:hypothetical protein